MRHPAEMSAGASRMGDSSVRSDRPAARVFQLDHLRELRGSEQVAAVCYRVRKSGIEFLLVQTRRGRWTFPKGNAEPGLTHAQAAALEAFEEAGVHGRMQEAPLMQYTRRKRSEGRVSMVKTVVNAHLCEVLWTDPPQESNRQPSWFAPDKAKRRLREGRPPDFGAELVRVVERAATRIQQATSGSKCK
jgi:8-oxo-dGTP pyrophosphatase MutT (NUDIX family)